MASANVTEHCTKKLDLFQGNYTDNTKLLFTSKLNQFQVMLNMDLLPLIKGKTSRFNITRKDTDWFTMQKTASKWTRKRTDGSPNTPLLLVTASDCQVIYRCESRFMFGIKEDCRVTPTFSTSRITSCLMLMSSKTASITMSM